MKKWALLLILFAIPLVAQSVEDVQQARIDSLEARLDSLVRTNNPIDLGERITDAYESGAAHSKRVINLMTVILAVVTLVLTVLGAIGVWQGTRGNIKAEQAVARAESLSKDLERKAEEHLKEMTKIKKEIVVAQKETADLTKRITRVDYMNQGYHYSSQKKYKEALEFFEKAIEEDPKNFEAWFQKSYCLGELGRYEEAKKSGEKTVELSKGKIGYYNLACAQARLGELDEALESLRKSKDTGEDFPGNAHAWEDDDFTPLRKGKYRKRFIEIVGPPPEGAEKPKARPKSTEPKKK